MSSLADHWNQGGNYLPEGDHNVAIGSYGQVKYNSGNIGVRFSLFDNRRRESHVSFVLTEAALWRIASFAQACGFTQEQCRTYDPYVFANHQRMVGRRLMITIGKGKPSPKDGKQYNEVTSFWAIEGTQDTPATTNPPAVPEQTEDPEDAIPF